TTIVGMLCLLSHMILQAKQLGILAAVGVFFAMIGSLLFIPAVLAVLPRAKSVYDASTESKNILDRMLATVARWIPQRPKKILLVTVVMSLGSGAGTTRIVVDTNPMSFYEQSEPIWRSTHLLNQHLGGWAGVSIMLQGNIKDPSILKEMDNLEQHLAKHPLVGMTNSLAGVMRKMNVVIHDSDKAFDRVPETRELI